MNKKVLSFVNKLEGYKTAIKELHWDADNMSQHQLCDDIADRIADFQDQVSEVEQSITGKLAVGNLKPTSYKVTNLKKFVEDVLDETNTFYKSLESEGDTYTGMKSDCESFLSDLQRNLYLVNFTMKEDLKRRLRDKINEGYRKEENIKTVFPGTKPSSDNGIIKRLEAISSGKNGQFNSRTFDSMDDAIEFFQRNLEKVGTLSSQGNIDDMTIVKLNANNGKTYNGMIDFIEVGDGKYKASIKFSNIGKESEEDFGGEDNIEEDMYDTWEQEASNKARRELNQRDKEEFYRRHPDFKPTDGRVEEGKTYNLTENEVKQLVKEAAIKLIMEYNKKMAKVSKFIKSTHGHRKNGRREASADERAEARRRLGIKDGVDESIEIDPKNKGKFTATKKATGKSTEELTHSKNPLTRKRAIFAQNAKKWNHNKK